MLPLAARTDRATYEKYHVRSSYSVPMVTGGRVIGVLGLNTVWEEREISSELLQGQRLLGEIFANALARKAGEESLRESEARFRTMADTAPVMIWMSGTDELCTFFNKGWLDFTGRTLEQELGNGWADGVHREDFDRCLEIYSNAFNARQEFTMEYRLRRFDGEYCWVLDHGVPRAEPDGAFLGYIGTAIDITELKRGEETLERERAFLRQVIDIDPNFIFAKDRDGRFTLVNQAVADAYGTTVDGLIGKTDADFNANRDEVEYFHRIDLDVIDTLQERFIPEEPLTDARSQIRWLQTVKRPIVEKNGVANQVLGASTDITRRKKAEAELRQQREELAHLTRVSTMGELAASLAHELNQPLTAILSNAQAAQRFLAANPAYVNEVTEILRDIVEDDNRASEIIQRMRAMVKKDDLKFSALDFAALISDVVLLVHSDAVLHNVSVSLRPNPGLPPVRGDKVQLQQVMLNLLLNAFDAMKDCPPGERQVWVKTESDGTERVKVSVGDRGIGLARDNIDKIFQPFYTTKREGLGMGLSISRSIIEAHGGRLWAENNPDRGATFYFTLPTSFVGHHSPTAAQR
jgi:PAS domain S-box-containing protein